MCFGPYIHTLLTELKEKATTLVINFLFLYTVYVFLNVKEELQLDDYNHLANSLLKSCFGTIF